MDKLHFQKLTEGSILGFVVGDALGVPAEFMSREELAADPVVGMRSGGAHGQRAGTWSDDSSMTLCAMDSIIEKGIDYVDLMQRFSSWLWNGSNTAYNEVFDVGGTTKTAIFRFNKKTPPLECGEKQDYCCGNGSLMRIIPAALYIVGQYGNTDLDDRAAEIIHNTSICTHAHPRCQMACGIYCSVIFRLCLGGELHKAVSDGIYSALDYYRDKSEFAEVYHEFESLREIAAWPDDQICGSGFVLHTLQASLWCLMTTQNYAECVLNAVNLGRDADTTAAVAGGLAGLWYGEDAIPKEWTEATAKYEKIKERCGKFADICTQ